MRIAIELTIVKEENELKIPEQFMQWDYPVAPFPDDIIEVKLITNLLPENYKDIRNKYGDPYLQVWARRWNSDENGVFLSLHLSNYFIKV